MAITIYDKAKVIRKEGVYYYLIKSGSKNCYTCGGQYVRDNNFRRKFISRSARESDWRLVAYGSTAQYVIGKIAQTYWNSPTSEIYGQIRFGNKKNIALYFVKTKVEDYSTFTNEQKECIDIAIAHGLEMKNGLETWAIDLANIPEHKRTKTTAGYNNDRVLDEDCGVRYNGIMYWNLDNL